MTFPWGHSLQPLRMIDKSTVEKPDPEGSTAQGPLEPEYAAPSMVSLP